MPSTCVIFVRDNYETRIFEHNWKADDVFRERFFLYKASFSFCRSKCMFRLAEQKNKTSKNHKNVGNKWLYLVIFVKVWS